MRMHRNRSHSGDYLGAFNMNAMNAAELKIVHYGVNTALKGIVGRLRVQAQKSNDMSLVADLLLAATFIEQLIKDSDDYK